MIIFSRLKGPILHDESIHLQGSIMRVKGYGIGGGKLVVGACGGAVVSGTMETLCPPHQVVLPKRCKEPQKKDGSTATKCAYIEPHC